MESYPDWFSPYQSPKFNLKKPNKINYVREMVSRERYDLGDVIPELDQKNFEYELCESWDHREQEHKWYLEQYQNSEVENENYEEELKEYEKQYQEHRECMRQYVVLKASYMKQKLEEDIEKKRAELEVQVNALHKKYQDLCD